MKGREFRQLALALPGTEEGSHMEHADFRAGGRIFATLAADEDDWGMVKLTPDQQEEFITEAPHVFSPVPGAWGRGGATRVLLECATPEITSRALRRAHENILVAAAAKKKRR